MKNITCEKCNKTFEINSYKIERKECYYFRDIIMPPGVSPDIYYDYLMNCPDCYNEV